MSGFALDANIVIDALAGHAGAQTEIRLALSSPGGAWVSRMVWVEVLSKGAPDVVAIARTFLSGLGLDEIDEDVALRAAALRRDRPWLKSPDAIILATAQLRGRTLITRNAKDFPPDMTGVRVPYFL